MKTLFIILFVCLLCGSCLQPVEASEKFTFAKMQGQQIAVVAYPLNKTAEKFTRNAISQFESILLDNGLIVLDKKKAEELKDVFTGLENPGVFITAETFVENAEKYDIQGLAAIYLSVGIEPGIAEFFTATAQADFRFIDKDAKVGSVANQAMGSPGSPPSDGLTRISAGVNAVQRAIDSACEKVKLEITDPAQPRSIKLKFVATAEIPNSAVTREAELDPSLVGLANLENQKWRREKATATARDPANVLGAVGGYITDTDFRRHPKRLFGSRVHLINLEKKKVINVFECSSVEKNIKREKGTKKVLDCVFLTNWRYLAGMTGNDIYLWDTERGRMLSSHELAGGIQAGVIHFVRSDQKSYVIIRAKRKNIRAFQITRDK